MKKFLTRAAATLAASLSLAASASAAPLDTKGIPADAIAIAHIDVEAAAKTKFGPVGTTFAKEWPALILGSKKKMAMLEKMRQVFEKDHPVELHGITIGLLPPIKKSGTDKEAGVSRTRTQNPKGIVLLLRGKYSSENAAEALKAAFERRGEDPKFVQLGKYQAWKPKPETYLVFLDSQRVLFVGYFERDSDEKAAREARVKNILDVCEGKGKSFAPSAALDVLAKTVGNPVALVQADVAAFDLPQGDPESSKYVPIPQTVFAALGESPDTLKLRVDTTLANDTEALALLGAMQSGLGKGMMEFSKEAKRIERREKEEANQTENVAEKERRESEIATMKKLCAVGMQFFGLVKLEAVGPQTKLALDAPAAPLLDLLEKAGKLLSLELARNAAREAAQQE